MTALRLRPLRPLSSATDLTETTERTHSTIEADVGRRPPLPPRPCFPSPSLGAPDGMVMARVLTIAAVGPPVGRRL
jgi:hypothetical protein